MTKGRVWGLVALQVACALGQMAKTNIIHRDLKVTCTCSPGLRGGARPSWTRAVGHVPQGSVRLPDPVSSSCPQPTNILLDSKTSLTQVADFGLATR
jgi:serine/threonine protein kinase